MGLRHFLGRWLKVVRRTGHLKPYGVWAAHGKALALALMISLGATPLSAAVTIVAFGDSLTQGFGLPEGEGFVPQLQAWLTANGAADVQLVNAGVSGDTTAGGAARIGWTLEGEVDAIIVTLGANDFLRGLGPDEARQNLDLILSAVTARGIPVVLSGFRVPLNFGEAFKSRYEVIYPDLAQKHGAILYPDFLAGIGSAKGLAAMRPYLQADATHPTRDGVARIVADIGPVILQLVAKARCEASSSC